MALEPTKAEQSITALIAELTEHIKDVPAGWPNAAAYLAYVAITKYIPKFLYFSDYNILPGKTHLARLRDRRNAGTLGHKDRSILALLNSAGVQLDTLLEAKSHEEMVARLQGFSIEVSDRVFQFWKQNEQLDVVIRVNEDTTETEEFQNGPNLYIHINNRRHRVDVPFDQRSKGFIWFFSFIVWFDDAQAQAEATAPIVLLLDEPGLSLHALAQADFLRYIEHLGQAHQVVYTTHSPFLVDSAALDRVRIVEDRANTGTTITDRLDSSDPKSILPLQAALGYTIAQNLFIGERNLLIEGPANLLFLQAGSSLLEVTGKASLDPNIVLIPVGGLDKVATFIALLHGNKLKFAVCTDSTGTPDQRLKDMAMQKIISEKALLDYGMFRPVKATTNDATDVEDLFEVPHYLEMFNGAYAKELNGTKILEADLPAGTRVVVRIASALVKKGISVRLSGGFNHFLVASRGVSAGLTLTAREEAAFEKLFMRINDLLS